MLLIGGTLPHKIGGEGLTWENLQNWRDWYSRLDAPHVFDLGTQTWAERHVAVAVPRLQQTGVQPGRRREGRTADGERREEYITELLLRSHLAAVFVPTRRSVVVFGGSRYFTGEYFHDVLELELPGPAMGTNGASMSERTSTLGRGRPEASRLDVHARLESRGPPKHFQRQVSRGLIGRFRALHKDNLIPTDHLEELVQQR